jgi:type I restriction enzyme R subunit
VKWAFCGFASEGFGGGSLNCTAQKESPHARNVLEAVLDKYSDQRITNLERMDLLKVKPLAQSTGPLEIIGRFGGKKQCIQAWKELEEERYKAGA